MKATVVEGPASPGNQRDFGAVPFLSRIDVSCKSLKKKKTQKMCHYSNMKNLQNKVRRWKILKTKKDFQIFERWLAIMENAKLI